jgi:RNA polymerase sigma-70 factor (ECF subfamily)
MNMPHAPSSSGLRPTVLDTASSLRELGHPPVREGHPGSEELDVVNEAPGIAVTDPSNPRHAIVAADEFQQLLMGVLSPAYGYALRLTRNRSDAEDLVQDAALNACRSRHTFEAGTNFKAWFFHILTRCLWAGHRRSKRRPSTVDFDDLPELYVYTQSMQHGMAVVGDDPARALIDQIGTERVAEALAQLPEEFAVVCTLYFMEDFAYQEIADVLDVPVGTVRSRLHRGRRMLQKSLWLVAEEAGIVRGPMPEDAR